MDSKEEEITKRIELLRKKNERLLQRHKEVQEDKQSAERSGQSMLRGTSRYNSPRERSYVSNKQTQGSPYSRAHMDNTEESFDQPTSYRTRKNQQRGRGQSNTDRAMSRRGRGGHHNQSYEAKRQENFRMIEEEMAQTEDNASKGDTDSCPGISRLLDDPRRKGELDPDNRWKSTRHIGNYGGLNFENVKTGMRWGGRTHRGRGRGRGMSKMQVTAEYTGRERQDQERWQVMREAADREIIARSKNAEGGWRREWDAEKGNIGDTSQDARHPKHYSEPRPRGAGRQRFTRRPRSVRDDLTKQNDDLACPEVESEPTGTEITAEQQEIATVPASAKPQRVRNKLVKNPGHLVQQRSQTPSSKDGTEVWAQNSHHSDEVGGEWKNRANQSGDQWLPSLEGNSNPAIDERRLEQQEDGATTYSRQLGRGWGSEKNIKATKAWVVDTENAGVTQRDESKNVVTDTDAVMTDDRYITSHSASPRLKKKSIGLTVEIDKVGRRVTTQSYQSNVTSRPETQNKEVDDAQKSGAADIVRSPDFLKTPEDLKHVVDWATEMDMQSPTYETRQLELLNSQQRSNQTNSGSQSNPQGHQDSPSNSDIQRPVVSSDKTSQEKPETQSSQTQSIPSTEACGVLESTYPDQVVNNSMEDVINSEKLAKKQSSETFDESDTAGTGLVIPKESEISETSLESGAMPQKVESLENSTAETVKENLAPPTVDDSHSNRTRSTVPEDLPLESPTPDHVVQEVASEDANSDVIPVHNDYESLQTMGESNNTTKEDAERKDSPSGTEMELIENGNHVPPVMQEVDTADAEADNCKERVTQIVGSNICDAKDVDGGMPTELGNVKHDPIDDAEDEFFECDEDRKKDTEESIQLRSTKEGKNQEK